MGAVPGYPGNVGALNRHTSVLLVSGFASVVLGALVMLIGVPYVVIRPGPAVDTLGSQDGTKLITVTGHPTYPTSGTLELTTVTIGGGPVSKVTVIDLLGGILDATTEVEPVKDAFPEGQTPEQSKAESRQEMVTSQEMATAAALTELGIQVPATVSVFRIDPVPAAKVLRVDDVLVRVGGRMIDSLSDISDGVGRTRPGEVVPVTVLRGGKELALSVPTIRSERTGLTVFGIEVNPRFRFPFQVRIQIKDIGGPSAGMMLALGVLDVLTPGPLTGGQRVAGTGTIDLDGSVGPIGGIQQKLIGARAAGAVWFLAPAKDCPDVVGHVPDGLHVVRVSTLHEARTVLGVIASGKGTETLPACTLG